MTIYKLNHFQEIFTHMITQNKDSSELLADIIPAGKLNSARDAMLVHQQGYIARLTEALGETFEGTWFSLGDELFFEICKQYIYKHLSTEYNLSNYGSAFPNFIGELDKSINLPFIHDMARFDWTFKELYHEGQHSSVQQSELLTIYENPKLKLEFGNAVKLFSAQYAIYDIWVQRKNANDNIIHFDFEFPEFLLLYKNQSSIYVKKITKLQYDIFTKIKNGSCLEEIIDNVAIENQNDFLHTFQIIASSNLISRIY